MEGTVSRIVSSLGNIQPTSEALSMDAGSPHLDRSGPPRLDPFQIVVIDSCIEKEKI